MCLTMMGRCEWFINKLSSVTVTDTWDTFIISELCRNRYKKSFPDPSLLLPSEVISKNKAI